MNFDDSEAKSGQCVEGRLGVFFTQEQYLTELHQALNELTLAPQGPVLTG